MKDLIDICNKAIRFSRKYQIDSCEVFSSSSYIFEIGLKKNELKILRNKIDKGIGIRVAINKSVGFSYTSDLSKIEDTVKSAYNIARVSPPDPDFKSFNDKGADNRIGLVNDEDIKNLNVEKTLDIITQVRELNLDKRIISLNANLTVEYIQVAIANTFGVENSDELTTSGIIVEASSREGDNFSGSFDFMYTRTLKEINAVELAKEVCKRAIYNLNKSKVSSMNTTVILDPICVSSVVGESIAAGLNAENVQKKRSFLSEDIGSQVFSEKLNIIDDGTIADGIGSLNFDAEGYPSRRNVLIDKGKIISLMHNSYTAKKENKESTGNAIRGSTFWDYSSLPSISPRNLIVEKGNKKIEDMISDLKKGILIRYTGDSPNIVTGDFTGIINEGYYVENGEIKFSIVEATFSGKIKSMLKNIVELSSDLKNVGNMRLPYIMIEDVSIGGGI